MRTLNVPNVSSSSRDLVLATLCYMQAAFLSTRFLRRFFRANALRLSLSSMSGCFVTRFLPSFFRHVGCSTPTTPRLLHHRHVCLLACCLRAFLLSSLRVPRFPRRRCPNFATASTVAAGNGFALLGCIIASRCCWQACTVSIDEFLHQSMSWRNIDSCENSIARTPSTAVVAYPRSAARFSVAQTTPTQSSSLTRDALCIAPNIHELYPLEPSPRMAGHPRTRLLTQ